MTARGWGKREEVRLLGEGGQGETFLVNDPDGNLGALKQLRKIADYKALERFRREINALVELDHPNIVRLIDHDLEDDATYFVMEYIEKGPLTAERCIPWTPIEKLAMFREILSAVSVAHANKIVHRDIKPENILLLDDGRTPVVADFGICYVDRGLQRITMTSEQVGARRFIAPELREGRLQKVEPSSDVYSLGKLLYWLFVGKVPDRENLLTLASVHVSEIDQAMVQFVDELLDQSVQLDPSQRFSDAGLFQVNLDRSIWRALGHCHIVDKTSQKLCNFCGLGIYRLEAETDPEHPGGVDNLNAFLAGTEYSGSKWMVLCCDYCGHVQYFRRDRPNVDNWQSE